MKKLDIYTEPKNDDKLEWNSETNRYQLTMAYVKTLRDAITFKNDSVLQRAIKQTSVRVYQWIVAHSCTVNRAVIDFLLNKTEQGRQFLIQCLTAQMEADLDWGYNDLTVRPVINAQTGQEGDRDNYRKNAISLECESIIDDSVQYFGINLLYMSPFPWSLFALARKYEN